MPVFEGNNLAYVFAHVGDCSLLHTTGTAHDSTSKWNFQRILAKWSAA